MLLVCFHRIQAGLAWGVLASAALFLPFGNVLAQTTNAFDQASDPAYAGMGAPNGLGSGGQNGGFGFGSWTFGVTGTGGSFIENNGPSGRSFDLWNGSANNSTVAVRPLNPPLSAGQSFSIQLRLNGLDSNLTTNMLALEDAGGNILFAYWHWGNEPNGAVNGWYRDASTLNGVAANFQYAYQSFQSFKFTLNSSTNYTFYDLSTGASFTGVISNASIAKVVFLRANGNYTPGNGQDFQFDQLQIITQNFSFQSLSPAANNYSAPANAAISLNAVAGPVLLKTNSVTLALDGVAVTPVVTGSSNNLAINYQPPAAFGYSTFHTVAATVTDANNAIYSTNWSFWVQPAVVAAGGAWTALNNAPPMGVNQCMLLGDGTVLGMNGDGRCCRLTPDSNGSYRNGTWTTILSMNRSRMFFASALLTNGNVFVAGGEYGSGRRHAELFDPLNNTWTKIPDPVPGPAFSDAIGKILPDGNVLVAPVSQFGGNVIYNVASNNWQTAASTLNQNEVCWVKLQNDCILTIDTGAQTSEHYVPSLNQWIADGNVPVPVYGYGAEIGAGFLLPNGNAFYIGGSTNTAIYTPGPAPASAGSWIAGPPMVFGANQLGAVDAPAAMMADGNILCVIGPVGGFNSPCYFYEYNYIANSFTQVGAPGGGSTYGGAPFGTSLLCLPTGEVLFIGGQNTQSLYIYSPNGAPLPAGKPAIASITENADGSYHLTGTNLNGISEGAAYGDDEQMDSNYPLIRMTNNTSHLVYYARAYNRSSTSVQTGNQVLSTEFSLPQGLPSGPYSLVAVANGNPSAPVAFIYFPPAVPTGLTAAGGGNTFVSLNWNTSSGATAYNVKRASTPAGCFSTIATVAGNSYTDNGLTNGLTYYYKIAAVGSSGPSSDSAPVAATPAGPGMLPGATGVNLSSYYNRTGIYTDGQSYGGGGFDGGGYSFSANWLGNAVAWNNLVFTYGPANAADVVNCAGQTITLPAGNFNTLQILATAVNGDQQNQTFTVTYTDNSTAIFTQSVADWTATSYYQNENRINRTPYRTTSGGGFDYYNSAVGVGAYVFPLDQTKTVKNVMLPNNGNLNVMAAVLANDSVSVPLNGYYNRDGIYTDGTQFTNSAGVDGGGHAITGTLIGNNQAWNGTIFQFGPMNATNVISGVNQTINLPAGKYSQLQMLGMAVNGNQPAQQFVVTYADASTTTFSQGISDWFTPQNYPGETLAVPMGYRNSSDGSSSENQSLWLYGYSFPLNASKTIQSIRMPNNGNVTIDAIALVPNYPPVFLANPFTPANAGVGQGYSGTIATNASDANAGSTLAFARVSGPSWLTVAANGTLSGTPGNPNAGTNTFVVSVSDQFGLSNTATMNLVVTGATVYTLTYTAGANGSISGPSPQFVVYSNNAAPVTAVPNTGYYFVNWSDSVTANPRTDTSVTNNISVTANFAPFTYTLTYNAGANGSISGATPQTVAYGGSGSAVTAVPNTGHAFTNWTDGLTVNPRTDSNVSSNITVMANFIVLNSNGLPAPWASNAVGTVTAATGAAYSNGVFTVAGAGANISGKNDNFWFISQPATNDATLIARVVSQSGAGSAARAGVMLRETLAAGSRSVFMGLVPASQAQWTLRSKTGGNSSTTTANGKPAPYWVKLTRGTNIFTGYISSDGSNWGLVAGVSLAAATNYFMGLAVCSGSSGSLNTAVFDSVSITNMLVPSAASNPATNPAVLGPLSVAPDSVSFTVTGLTNSVWQLQDSSDLQNWNTLENIGLIDGSIQQVEDGNGRSQRFLRLKSSP